MLKTGLCLLFVHYLPTNESLWCKSRRLWWLLLLSRGVAQRRGCGGPLCLLCVSFVCSKENDFWKVFTNRKLSTLCGHGWTAVVIIVDLELWQPLIGAVRVYTSFCIIQRRVPVSVARTYCCRSRASEKRKKCRTIYIISVFKFMPHNREIVKSWVPKRWYRYRKDFETYFDVDNKSRNVDIIV